MKSWDNGAVSESSPKLKLVSAKKMFEVCEAAGTAIAKRQPFPKHAIGTIKINLNNFRIDEITSIVLR